MTVCTYGIFKWSEIGAEVILQNRLLGSHNKSEDSLIMILARVPEIL